jgi:hypothetical protein
MMVGVPAAVLVVAVDVAVVADGAVESAPGFELPPDDEHEPLSDAIFALVIGPTLPTGLMPCALWKAATAFSVTAP